MYSLAQGGYTHAQVKKMLTEHRKIAFDFALLNGTDKFIKTLRSASGSISFCAGSEIMGTGSFTVSEKEVSGYDLVDYRISPYFKIESPVGWLSYPLGIYIMTSPRRRDGSSAELSIDCYDKSIILKEDKLADRLYIPAGSNYVREVQKVIASAGIKKVSIEGSSLTLKNDLEFEIGTDKLSVVNDLLYAINYNPIHFDRNGTAVSERYIEPSVRKAEEEYLTDRYSIIKSGAQQTRDLYNIPNVIIRYTNTPDADDLRSEYINDSVDSILSTVRRGRRVVDIESVDDIADQNTLDAYTKRVAIEKSQINDTVTLPTALMPHHSYKDCLFVRHDNLGIGAKFIENSWSMDLEVGGTMQHQIKRVTLI